MDSRGRSPRGGGGRKGPIARSFRKVKKAIRPTRARSADAGGGSRGRNNAIRRSFRKVAKRVRGRSGTRSHSPSRARGGGDNFEDEPPRRQQRRRSVGKALHSSFRKVKKSRVARGARTAARKSFRKVKKSRVGRAAGRSFRKVKKSRVGRAAGRSFRRIAPKEKCPFWKIMCYLIPCIMIVVSIMGILTATEKVSSDVIKGLIPTFSAEDFRRNDPWSSKTGLPVWNNGGTNSGLELTFYNALDETFQSVFKLAIADWDFGNPDALTLKSNKISEDPNCTPVDGVVKVCNSDYGETKWRGLSLAAQGSDGYISSNICKFNDYYLRHDNQGTRQYTMCHEIGHSFGLPHTDEDFENQDLGNCLDYTNNYSENKHPDVTNYEYLTELYGVITGRRRRRQRYLRDGGRQDYSSTSQEEEEDDDDTTTTENNNPLTHNKPLPLHIREQIHDVVSKLEKRMDNNAHEDGWKLLHRTKYGEEHHMDLQDGYSVRVHMLLAN